MTDTPERIWLAPAWANTFNEPEKVTCETEYVRADLVTTERDRILAILDAHPNASPGWLALQIREGRL